MRKIKLPNGETLEISPEIIEKFKNQSQKPYEYEKGGFLIGRSTLTQKTKILDITLPYPKDKRGYISFNRKDKKHIEYLKKAKEKLMYFKGNWHTHPEDYPSPSLSDRMSWYKALFTAKVTKTNYIIFIIVGRKEIGVWAGNIITKKIEEVGLTK